MLASLAVWVPIEQAMVYTQACTLAAGPVEVEVEQEEQERGADTFLMPPQLHHLLHLDHLQARRLNYYRDSDLPFRATILR